LQRLASDGNGAVDRRQVRDGHGGSNRLLRLQGAAHREYLLTTSITPTSDPCPEAASLKKIERAQLHRKRNWWRLRPMVAVDSVQGTNGRWRSAPRRCCSPRSWPARP